MAGAKNTKTKEARSNTRGKEAEAEDTTLQQGEVEDTGPAEAVGFDDFGGDALGADGGDFDEFIQGEDLSPGAIVHGLLNGAKLLPDTDNGGYRVVFAITLKRALGINRAGDTVGLGERAKLRSLRRLTLGSEVMVRADGKKKLKKGGKTMHTFSVKARLNTVTGAKTVQQLLSETWKASGASADEWNRVQEDTSFPGDEPGSQG